MALNKTKEKRSSERHHVESALPICIRVDGAKANVFARLFNVSDFGLGLIVTEKLAIGQKVTVVTLKSKMIFHVAWLEENFKERGTFLCGLEPTVSKEEFLVSYGSFMLRELDREAS